MKKNTPTPWHLEDWCLYATRENGHLVRVADFTPADDDMIPNREVDANSELAIRAVNCHEDLLAALNEMMRQFEPCDPGADDGVSDCDAIVLARAAIAKAEGKK